MTPVSQHQALLPVGSHHLFILLQRHEHPGRLIAAAAAHLDRGQDLFTRPFFHLPAGEAQDARQPLCSEQLCARLGGGGTGAGSACGSVVFH